MTSTHLRTVALSVALGMVLVACGQKPGVHVESGPLALPGEAPTDEFATDVQDEFLEFEDDPLAEGEAEAGDPTVPDDAPRADPSQPAPTEAPQQQQQQQQQAQPGRAEPRGSDRTGVTDTTITLTLHAPVTGAAPLPATSFQQSGDLYWRWVTEQGGEKIIGRDRVELVFADDRYEPSTARQVCRQLASRGFFVGGGGGTDQIQACGELAQRSRFPYFSAGVTEAGLEGNDWYFALSMTYRQQGELLAQYVRRNFGNAKSAAIITQTPNFNDAVQGWEAGVQRHGVNYHQTLRHPRGDQSWYSGFASQLGAADVEVVYMLTSPLDYIRFAQVARDQGHSFQYVGVGVSMGLNDVLRNGCPAVDGGVFFSPFPALELADQIDPNFNRAARQYGVPNDDIAWALWGIARSTHEFFDLYEETFGTDLTREDFRDLVSNAGRIESDIFPPVEFAPGNHFGGTGVHVLAADCSTGQYKDGGTFKSSF